MNEKTEELRDIFTSVADDDTVTESQEDTRGSLADRSSRPIDERLKSVIARMQERYGIETPLSTEELIVVAKEFYEGTGDAAIADDLGVDEGAVFDARLSLHLVGEDDAAEVDLVAIRNRDEDDAALADEYGVDEERIRRYRRVAAAKDESRAANDRYRDEFDSILADADLSSRMTEDVRDDGLEDATEGMETDVSF